MNRQIDFLSISRRTRSTSTTCVRGWTTATASGSIATATASSGPSTAPSPWACSPSPASSPATPSPCSACTRCAAPADTPGSRCHRACIMLGAAPVLDIIAVMTVPAQSSAACVGCGEPSTSRTPRSAGLDRGVDQYSLRHNRDPCIMKMSHSTRASGMLECSTIA